jgi:uncharacterized membrane protein (UPF0136 family)
METRGDGSSATRQLLVIAALLGLGYVCTRTLRFTNDGLNLAFVCGFLLVPFFAIRPVLRLHRWPRSFVGVILTPLLAFSSLALLFTVGCDIPAYVEHIELSTELSSVQQRNYSVHLLWEETAGGAAGPHGVGVQQRMFIVPGLYTVKSLDYFEGACEGSLSVEGPDKVRLHLTKSCSLQQEVDKVYSLKRRVYF